MNSGPSHSPRMVNRDRRLSIIRKGSSKLNGSDLYHLLLTIPWSAFLTGAGVLYILANAIFAILYLLGGDCIANAKPGSFGDAFFFSVQTLATIGYGAMYPRTPYANIIVALEAWVGLLSIALITGLAFARCSRPTAKVLFSNVAVITPFNGVPTFMFRTANQRRNLIVEAAIRVSLTRQEITQEGYSIRRLYDLDLVRRETPIFALTWTVMHPITESSPLYGLTKEDLQAQETEIIITLTGLDETVSQTIHARYSYTSPEILWNLHFVDLFSENSSGKRVIDYRKFHDVVPNS